MYTPAWQWRILSAVGELVLVLCGVVVKTAFRLWIGDNALADDLAADLTDMIKGRVGNVLDQRKIRSHFARTEEMVADQLLATLGQEYRDLDEGERNAAIIAVTITFQRAQLTDKQLFTADLDRLYLYQFVRKFAGNATSGLSEGGIALYDRVLEQCCGYIIVVADKLPGFQGTPSPSCCAAAGRSSTGRTRCCDCSRRPPGTSSTPAWTSRTGSS